MSEKKPSTKVSTFSFDSFILSAKYAAKVWNAKAEKTPNMEILSEDEFLRRLADEMINYKDTRTKCDADDDGGEKEGDSSSTGSSDGSPRSFKPHSKVGPNNRLQGSSETKL